MTAKESTLTNTSSASKRKPSTESLLFRYMLECVLVVVAVMLAFYAPGFSTVSNLLNVMRAISMLGIVACGMTAVIVCAEIDLSVGSGMALAGCILAWVVGACTPLMGSVAAVILGSCAAIVVGMACGAFSGAMKAALNVPTFITTLGLFTALRGAANLITGGYPLATFPGWFDFVGNGALLGLPFPAFVFVAVVLIMHFVMSYTTFGRAVYAVGGNPEAARLSGIKVSWIKTATLMLTGGLAALSGILIASQIGSGTGTTATGMELDVIAATIIGGTSLFGGKGRIWGTFIGVLFLGIIGNGMTLLNVSEYWQYVVRGALIVAAVMLSQVTERRR
ncbi:ABC transporter permease [Paraburkholderia sp. DHOC27]|uniref:ABC transporter permease n=1 Tax=Paraburkholderia sp. DHOC27 TaxID=2303330 RepID=UPI000E3BF769|nr:ABC transporter permease [Paraburkholderia sp. DHOC27]RFU49749.1 ABC transporter permease [Paraburkholderia sp. DHOC27]